MEVDFSCVTFTQTPSCSYTNNTFTGSDDGGSGALWNPPFTVNSANSRLEVYSIDTSLYSNYNPKTVYIHNTLGDDATTSVVFSFNVYWSDPCEASNSWSSFSINSGNVIKVTALGP